MQENKRMGLMKEAQDHTPDQEPAATVEPEKTCNSFMVMEALRPGKENAISVQELYTYLKFDNVRELQKEIARERKAGAVILSNCQEGGGYFLPGSDQEVKQFIKTLENRARNTFAALHSVRQQEEVLNE
ncbi:hypothetical protein [Clostridium sp. Marseille-P2415]|uniref:hypothetical protein n=1 Tax=Clostridium sp. Marseille-P2415 TaxID=1805471 RepID=UPI00098891AF|nr:hypothetical protein [Clostridium sp. Marseille-P2415]